MELRPPKYGTDDIIFSVENIRSELFKMQNLLICCAVMLHRRT